MKSVNKFKLTTLNKLLQKNPNIAQIKQIKEIRDSIQPTQLPINMKFQISDIPVINYLNGSNEKPNTKHLLCFMIKHVQSFQKYDLTQEIELEKTRADLQDKEKSIELFRNIIERIDTSWFDTSLDSLYKKLLELVQSESQSKAIEKLLLYDLKDLEDLEQAKTKKYYSIKAILESIETKELNEETVNLLVSLALQFNDQDLIEKLFKTEKITPGLVLAVIRKNYFPIECFKLYHSKMNVQQIHSGILTIIKE
ncbi:hypothetical protein HDV01_005739 [Terramyces sp. JEL0728]|nr:hypothetical protein HDV01_005739 [Terramyces sp. JEL0728]